MNGSGVETASVSAPVSNQMKTAVCPDVYGAWVSTPEGPADHSRLGAVIQFDDWRLSYPNDAARLNCGK